MLHLREIYRKYLFLFNYLYKMDRDPTMTTELHERGLSRRKEVLGAAQVE